MPRSPKANISEELILLVREMMTQQAEVLKVAMETQKSQAEVLNQWIKMFTPQSQPQKSTTEEERIRMREEMEAGEWEPLDMNPFPSDTTDLGI